MTGTDNRARTAKRAVSGLDRLIYDDTMIRRLATRRVCLLTNHAAATVDHVPASVAVTRALAAHGSSPLCLFTPEHGIRLAQEAGAAVANSHDPLTGLPVVSLYAGSEDDTDTALDGLDTLIIDLRDVGVRCYTYAATAAKFAVAALERHIEVIVCDRANPLGPAVAGPRPEPERRSLLAHFDVPFIHGRTIGELISPAIAPVVTEAPFSVYPADVSLQPPLGWIPPSPALSHPDAVAAYGGLVLLEATNISECRATSVSFRAIAAPGLDTESLADAMNSWTTGFAGTPGEVFTTRAPDAGRTLPAVMVRPRKVPRRDPLSLGVHLVAWLIAHHPDFAWLPAGESGFAIDSLFGRTDLRTGLDRGESAEDILHGWRTD